MFLLTFLRPSGSVGSRVERQHLQPFSGEVRQAIDGRAPDVPVPCQVLRSVSRVQGVQGQCSRAGGSRSRGGPFFALGMGSSCRLGNEQLARVELVLACCTVSPRRLRAR